MAKGYVTKNGNRITLLNPSEKGAKYAAELKFDIAHTNNFEPKFDENGEAKCLTPGQRAYRAGYLSARSDSAKAWCKKNGVQSRAKKRARR